MWHYLKIGIAVFTVTFIISFYVVPFLIQHYKSDVRLICRDAVKKLLHDPKSAEFDDYKKFVVTAPWEEKNNAVFVMVTGRAKNAFNALRLMSVRCMAEPLPNKQWKVVSLENVN